MRPAIHSTSRLCRNAQGHPHPPVLPSQGSYATSSVFFFLKSHESALDQAHMKQRAIPTVAQGTQ